MSVGDKKTEMNFNYPPPKTNNPREKSLFTKLDTVHLNCMTLMCFYQWNCEFVLPVPPFVVLSLFKRAGLLNEAVNQHFQKLIFLLSVSISRKENNSFGRHFVLCDQTLICFISFFFSHKTISIWYNKPIRNLWNF